MNSFSSIRTIGRRGSALLIVLAFLLLLTTITVAFLSRATFERTLSNASFSQGKTDLVVQGSVATIISDLQQEVVAGSTTMATGNYYPTSQATMVPFPVLGGISHAAPPAVDGLENLVKISYRGTAFFSGTGYSASGPTRAPSSGAAVSTTVSSLNNRLISVARWNAPLFMAKATPTSTTDFTPVSKFVAPDWIYVARDGTNPSAWDAMYISSSNVSPTSTVTAGSPGTNAVTQRYAYAIYDEGGTLDLNVAGNPSYPPSAPSAWKYSPLQPYKNALTFADLAQLPYLNTNTMTVAGGSSAAMALATQIKVISAIVGWRNNSSAPVSSGSFPNYSTFQTVVPNKTTLNIAYTGYPLDYFVLNAAGFLNPGGFVLKGGNNAGANIANQTDNVFASRQQLIQFFTQGLGQNSTFSSSLASLQNVLQYLGTFSRDINQPSYAPSPTRPVVLAASSGGTNAAGLDNAINPSFLAVAATSTFARNDGTSSVVGEPLVKRRFALNCLAWLTCKGPICSDDVGTLSTDTTIQTLITTYETTYGIPAAFLAKGGPANILKYFGLQWDSANLRWVYMHGRSGDATTLTGGLPSSAPGAIMKLQYAADSRDVVRAGREADFFELLKAAINVGALGKAITNSTTATTGLGTNYDQQAKIDSSVDYSIMQIGVNIIDQFTPDNFPTRIVFDDGSGAASNLPTGQAVFSGFGGMEFRGIKNLPFINRVRNGFIKVVTPVLSIPPYNGGWDSGVAAAWNSPADLSDTGVGAYMVFPEIWNPHDWNSTNLTQTQGVIGPTQFRIFAYSDSATVMGATNSGSSSGAPLNNSFDGTTVVDQSNSPGYNSKYGFTWGTPGTGGGEPHQLNSSNTEMDFTIPTGTAGAALFREPTLLFQPGLPNNSGLKSVALVKTNTTLGIIATNATDQAFFSPNAGGGLLSAVGDSGNLYGGLPQQSVAATSTYHPYIGFYVNTNPLWWVTHPAYTAPSGGPVAGASSGSETMRQAWQSTVTGNFALHYYLQCMDPSGAWITYDEKWDTLSGNPNWDVMKADSNSFLNGIQRGQTFTQTLDPRTSRFDFVNNNTGLTSGFQFSFPPYYASASATGWFNKSQDMLLTFRSGTGPGFVGLIFGTVPPTSTQFALNSLGWYNTNATTWSTNASEPLFRPGLFCQNNPSTSFASDGTPFDQTPPSSDIASPPFPNEYYADPDGVVRRASDAYVLTAQKATSPGPLEASPAAGPGQPLATANTAVATGTPTVLTRDTTVPSQSASRPMVLNRPFNSVAELGYVFSGTPWKNLDMFTPESGYAALLDIFCISDTNDANGLVAGKVNLNTRQAPVLQAVLAEAYKDQWTPGTVSNQFEILGGNGSSLAGTIASGLVARTTSTATPKGPMTNLNDLVGKWVPGSTTITPAAGGTSCYAGSSAYDGFSADLGGLISSTTDTNAANALGDTNIQRFREATMRALANCGTARVWNLMIDVVAQTGRFPAPATSLANFNVEGERRYWVHVAIDRYTGKVLDEQIEEVKE